MSESTTNPTQQWHGTYLSEDEIVVDMLARIKSDPDGVKIWNDPASWKLPYDERGRFAETAPEHAGSLMFVGMTVRNWYGLWKDECPHTITNGPDLEITDGIITDPRFPDNLSGRIIDRVRAVLAAETEARP